MARAAIGYSNLADEGMLTASSAAVLAPALNLQHQDVARTWQGAAGGADYVVCDLSSAQSVNAVAVMGLVADTIRVRISSVDASGATGDLHDSGVVAVNQNYLQHLVYLSAAVSGRYIRIDLVNGSGEVEAGRLFAGTVTGFDINFSYGWLRGRLGRSQRSKTIGGQTVIDRRTAPRTLDLTFDFASESEANGLIETVDLTNGIDADVLFIVDPESGNLSRDFLWGLITEFTPVSNPAIGIFVKNYKIEQRL